MTMPTLTAEQMASLAEYQTVRDAPRNTIQHGVYPNIVKTLQGYDDLEAALQGDLSAWGPTHEGSMAAVQPYIAQLISHMDAIVGIVDGIAAADPTVFPSLVPDTTGPEDDTEADE